MRVAWMLVAVAGCGDDRRIAIDAPPGIEGAVDARTPTCAPRAGSRPVRRLLAGVADAPTTITSPPGDPRLFVAQQDGRISVIEDGVVREPAFLDLADDRGGPVVDGGERGLLGLAFHPRHAETGTFYVYYTAARDLRWANVLAEYRTMPGDPDRADPTSARVLIDLDDVNANHNGGMLRFGPDGMLYLATGDGGGQGDPREHAEDPHVLFGKILRLDVDGSGPDAPYGIPPGNPFALGGGAPEVLVYGLRNPWRFTIDPPTGDLYVGDVGGGRIEEINVVAAAEVPGADFGWDDCEGLLDAEGTGCAAPVPPRNAPIVSHDHADTPSFQAVIGGEVYRGACFPDVIGRYFYSDHYAGGISSFVFVDGQVTAPERLGRLEGWPTTITTFGTDWAGEIYAGYRDGTVHRVEFE